MASIYSHLSSDKSLSRTKRDGWEEVSRVTDSQVSNTSNLVNRGDSYKKMTEQDFQRKEKYGSPT